MQRPAVFICGQFLFSADREPDIARKAGSNTIKLLIILLIHKTCGYRSLFRRIRMFFPFLFYRRYRHALNEY
jgi:hypothetical protein